MKNFATSSVWEPSKPDQRVEHARERLGGFSPLWSGLGALFAGQNLILPYLASEFSRVAFGAFGAGRSTV